MDPEHQSGCLVCGKDLNYLPEPVAASCFYCGEMHQTDVICHDGHFICDQCHRAPSEEIIETFCKTTQESDPLVIIETLMDNPQVKMHGPEHHFLVPAVLLAAYYNTKGEPGQKLQKVGQARQRAAQVIGGFCGTHGDCGAAVGTGIFISLVTGATPLSREEWKLSNLVTAESLRKIALHGGPRCCKRNAFLAIIAAVNFCQEHLGITIPLHEPVTCHYFINNRECLVKDCPFFPE